MRLKNPKAKGSRIERSLVKDLLQCPDTYVIKAGGSLGLFDLVALGSRYVDLVQVKANRRPGRKEMAALKAFKAPSYAAKWLVVVKDRKKPVWELIL